MMKEPCSGFSFLASPTPVDDELNGNGPPHTALGRGGDGLVKGVGMQRVAVVVNRVEGLQGRADVVEVDFLRVQGAATGLDVVLELLGPFVGAVFAVQCLGPNPPGHAANDGVFRIDAIGEEEAQVGAKLH